MIRFEDVHSYTDHYFSNSRRACEHTGACTRVLYQVFQRGDSLLCGMKYVMQLLGQLGPEVEVHGLHDGDRIAPREPVLHIVGPVNQLFELETVYLGLLARMTKVATNVRTAVEAANGKPVLFFPARFDVPEVQEYDGYAAKVGGCIGGSTDEQAKAWNAPSLGTMPHALIAAFKGDTTAATLALAESLPNEPIWALIDFHNDSPQEAAKVAKAFKEKGKKLSGVRVDTSQDVVDATLQRMGIHRPGVVPELVREIRRALDEVGANHVQIGVSGGFSPEKIRDFEAAKVPVDVYAVGERFFRGSTPFTSDIVAYFEGEKMVHCSKVGREYEQNPRFQRLK